MAKRKKTDFSKSKVKKNKPSPKVKPTIFVEPTRQLSNLNYWIIAICIGLAGLLVYAPSANYGFVYDDDAVVKDNKFVKAGFDGLDDIWSTSYFKGMNSRMNVNAFRPIPLTTLAVELALFDNPPATAQEQLNWTPNAKIYHVTNLVYYGLIGVFLFLFLARLLRDYHYFIPIAITLLFMLHPIHLEVVANIKSRDTMLGFLNFAIAGWLLLKGIDAKKNSWLIPSVAFFALGVLSKEEVVTFLAVIPAMLWCFRPQVDWKKIALWTLPFIVVTGLLLMWRDSVIGDSPIRMKAIDNSLIGADEAGLLFPSRFLAWWHYFRMCFFPHPLISDYSLQTLPNVGWTDWRAIVGLLVYVVLGLTAVWGMFKRKMVGFGALYYLATFSVFSSFIFWNFSIYNDRFLFSPVLGMMLLVGWFLSLIVKPNETDRKPSNAFGRFAAKNILPIALVILFAGASVWKISTHLPVWKDRFALFAHDMELAPTNARMLKNHGGSLARQAMKAGRGTAEQKQLAEEGIVVLKRSLELYPRIATGWVHLGNCYTMVRDYTNAEDAYRKALNIDTRNHHATINLANILCRNGQAQEAINLIGQLSKQNMTAGDLKVLEYCQGKL